MKKTKSRFKNSRLSEKSYWRYHTLLFSKRGESNLLWYQFSINEQNRTAFARGQGFEPRLTVLETVVLPLHHPSNLTFKIPPTALCQNQIKLMFAVSRGNHLYIEMCLLKRQGLNLYLHQWNRTTSYPEQKPYANQSSLCVYQFRHFPI